LEDAARSTSVEEGVGSPVVVDLGEVQDVSQDGQQRITAVQNCLSQFPAAAGRHIGCYTTETCSPPPSCRKTPKVTFIVPKMDDTLLWQIG